MYTSRAEKETGPVNPIKGHWAEFVAGKLPYFNNVIFPDSRVVGVSST